MAVMHEQRVCEFCLDTSDVKPLGELDTDGWTAVDDVEGTLDRCPACTETAADIGELLTSERPTDGASA